MDEQGFTFIELMVTLCVASIMLMLCLPGFTDQIQSAHVRTTAHSLLESVNHARTLAVTHGQRATLTHPGSWDEGWEVFLDKNDNGIVDEDEVVIKQHAPLKSVHVNGNRPLEKYVSFIASGESRYVGKANGGAFQAGTFTVCPTTPGAGYELVLARSGRLRMDKLSEAECAAL